MNQKLENVHLILKFHQISNSKAYKAIGLNWSEKTPVEKILS